MHFWLLGGTPRALSVAKGDAVSDDDEMPKFRILHKTPSVTDVSRSPDVATQRSAGGKDHKPLKGAASVANINVSSSSSNNSRPSAGG